MPVRKNVKNTPSMAWSIAGNVLKPAADVQKNAAKWWGSSLNGKQ
jgi:hypothetical protein